MTSTQNNNAWLRQMFLALSKIDFASRRMKAGFWKGFSQCIFSIVTTFLSIITYLKIGMQKFLFIFLDEIRAISHGTNGIPVPKERIGAGPQANPQPGHISPNVEVAHPGHSCSADVWAAVQRSGYDRIGHLFWCSLWCQANELSCLLCLLKVGP